MMINRERWRYSYYRKCFTDKLRRFAIQLPAKKNALDEDTMEAVVQAAPYWDYIRNSTEPPPHIISPSSHAIMR
jgi:hypothetical protein